MSAWPRTSPVREKHQRFGSMRGGGEVARQAPGLKIALSVGDPANFGHDGGGGRAGRMPGSSKLLRVGTSAILGHARCGGVMVHASPLARVVEKGHPGRGAALLRC